MIFNTIAERFIFCIKELLAWHDETKMKNFVRLEIPATSSQTV